MPFLRVDCLICGASWSYYDEKYEPIHHTTAGPYQAGICPNCGSVGVIASGVDQNANQKTTQ